MLEIPKSNSEFTPGTWRRGIAGDKIIIIFICPVCGAASEINGEATNHIILPDGTVTPSVVCDAKGGCTFHDFIKLIDWQ